MGHAPRVAVTRPDGHELTSLLTEAGLEVVHVPLIETVDPIDPTPLKNALARLAHYDWVVVTSPAGADRVCSALREHDHLRLAAVGTGTAQRLSQHTGRAVEVVPDRQTADDLVAVMPAAADRERVLVAQADRADERVAAGLDARGYDVTVVTAYRTQLRRPDPSEREQLANADAVTLASGSAANSWFEVFGAETPPIVVAIGPRTAEAADKLGLKVSHICADHSVAGLARTTIDAFKTHRG